MSDGDKMVNNILDWMETIDDHKSDSLIDIITGVESRNINIPKSIPESDVVEACNKEVRKRTNYNVLSVTVLTTPFYDEEFSTTLVVNALYLYEYKSNKKLSPEKAEEFDRLKRQFVEKYNNRIISNDEIDQIDKERSALYNFCSSNAYEGEDAVEVMRVDYNKITVTL
jgi:hypothetical protein